MSDLPIRILAACIVAAVAILGRPALASDLLQDRMRETIEALGAHRAPAAVLLADSSFITAFYARRGMHPAWTRPEQVRQLYELINHADDDGLDPQDYHRDRIAQLIAQLDASPVPHPQLLVDLDIALTDALARLCFHLHYGKVNPERLDAKWNYSRELAGTDPVALLQSAIDAPSLRDFVSRLVPQLRGYQEYRRALARLRELERKGGWPYVPGGPSIRPGMEDARVPILRHSLAVRGFLPEAAMSDTTTQYDVEAQTAVVEFQKRHRLAPDGIVGPATREALNVPVSARIDQVRANMERARWVFRDIEPSFIVVNIASFEIFMVRDREIVWRSRVQVGRPYRQTPMFKAKLQSLVFNPTRPAQTMPSAA